MVETKNFPIIGTENLINDGQLAEAERQELVPIYFSDGEEQFLLPPSLANADFLTQIDPHEYNFTETRHALHSLFQEYNIQPSVEPMRPELMTEEVQMVLQQYPALIPFVLECMPVLDTMHRGGGLTAYWDQENLGQEKRETIAEHTVDVMRHIRQTFDRYPALAEAMDVGAVLRDALFHDFQEMAGGDLSRSKKFYDHAPFAGYLADNGQHELAQLMVDRNVEKMTNGLAPTFNKWWVQYEAHFADQQEAFGQRLFGTIQHPETAEAVAAGNYRFENRKKFMNDTESWTSRWADIKQEISGMVRGESGDIFYYRNLPRYSDSGEQHKVPSLPELKERSIDLTTWRYLQPAIAIWGSLRGNPEAQYAVHCNVIEDLSQIAGMAGGTLYADRIQQAFEYWNRMTYEVEHQVTGEDGAEHDALHFVNKLPARPWLKKPVHNTDGYNFKAEGTVDKTQQITMLTNSY